MDQDLRVLSDLNREFIGAMQHSDIGRFEEILAADFVFLTADGEKLDRREFIRRVTIRPPIQGLEAIEVDIRVMVEFAIVHGRTIYNHADGAPGSRRYTNCWGRREGHWLALSSQFTNTPAATI